MSNFEYKELVTPGGLKYTHMALVKIPYITSIEKMARNKYKIWVLHDNEDFNSHTEPIWLEVEDYKTLSLKAYVFDRGPKTWNGEIYAPSNVSILYPLLRECYIWISDNNIDSWSINNMYSNREVHPKLPVHLWKSAKKYYEHAEKSGHLGLPHELKIKV